MTAPNDSRQSDLYTGGAGWHNTYALDPGVCVLPLAEDPPTDPEELKTWSPVVVLRLHAPYRIRTARYAAEKATNPPPIPGMNDTGAFVLVAGQTRISQGLNTTGRNFDWSVTCDLMFVEDCVPRNQDGYVLGAPPFSWITTAENEIQYGYSPPSTGLGAVALAGREATTGYRQGLNIADGTGALNNVWGYNSPGFFPGQLVSDDMANGGPPVSTGG